MKVLVCIKQVPDMESRFTIGQDRLWYETRDLAWRINEYDEYAIEQAVRLKESAADTDITVLCIGPERVKESIKKALAMGCDRGFHILHDAPWTLDAQQISKLIAVHVRDSGFHYVFCGMQSQDRGSCQVGVLLAESLGMPCLTTIVSFERNEEQVRVRRELEGGSRAIVSVKGPALFTCQLGLNTPRYPTLPNIMKAKKKELLSVPCPELLPAEKLVTTSELFVPERKGGGLLLEGEPGALVRQLIQIIKEKTTALA